MHVSFGVFSVLLLPVDYQFVNAEFSCYFRNRVKEGGRGKYLQCNIFSISVSAFRFIR
jgi:hypothetical protein